MGNGVYSSLVIFFLNIIIFYDQAFRAGGQTADMATVGTTMFTCIIWAVNCQIALTMSHFTWIQHLFVWGSIVTWYLFLILYGMTSPLISGNAYQLLVEVLGPAPIYWAATLLVTIACNLPYFAHISFQKCFNPMDHHVIQEIKYYKKDIEDQRMWTRERSKARQDTKIGFTARVEAKIRHLRGRLQKKHSNLVASWHVPDFSFSEKNFLGFVAFHSFTILCFLGFFFFFFLGHIHHRNALDRACCMYNTYWVEE
jgi:phospholipid-translocating ATPase